MQSTIKALTEDMNRCVLQGKDVRSIIAQEKNVLNNKMVSLEKTITESYRQLARYMILWEYQNMGFEKYIHIAKGENCEVCQKLDGQVFDIADAEVGVNLSPIHPNCDCKDGIIDRDGNIIALIAGGNNAKSAEKSVDTALDYLQTTLDIVGLIPFIGEFADGLNAIIYTLRGDYINAALSSAALLPIGGQAATIGKLTKKALKFADEAKDIGKIENKAIKGIAESVGKSSKVYSANGDTALRATRRPSFDSIMKDGIEVDGNNFKMNEHTYNSLFKSGRKDIMPDDILDALKADPIPGTPGSLEYVNTATGTSVFVNSTTKEIVGVWPAGFGR